MWRLLLLPVALGQARLGAAPPPNSTGSGPSAVEVASCSQRLFELLGNPSYDGFTACVDEKLNTSNSSWFGPSAGAYAQCWCQWNMSTFVSAQGCQGDGNWNWLTQVQCGANCSDGAALKCKRSCPAFCFEAGPGLPGCACRTECMPLVGCMAISKEEDPDFNNDNETEAPVQCVTQMRQSKEMKRFGDCALANVTYGNHWRSLSETYQCLCAGDLQEELHSQNCCDSMYLGHPNQPFCDADCSLNCSTEEALKCAEDCGYLCEGSETSQACKEKCLQTSAPCQRYKVCPAPKATSPVSPFSYVCDDGEAPSATGCCKGVFDNDRCPLLCNVQWKTSDMWNPSSARCECGGCPKTRQESQKLMNETLLAVFERDATKQLFFILMSHGLHEITPEMRNLFAMQMEAVESELARYDGKGLLNWQLVHDLRVISSYYFHKLQEAAAAEAQSISSHSGGAGVIWFALISSVCVISTIVIGCIISKSLALQSRTQVQALAAPPPETLVVGRPICSKDSPPEDAVQGVLVREAAASQ